MSNRTRFATQLNGIVSSLETALRTNGVTATGDVIKGTYSQEGAVAFAQNFEDQTRDMRSVIADHLSDLDASFSQEAMSSEMSESMRAGLIAGLASQGGAAGYHKEALRSSDPGQFSLESVYTGLGGQIDVIDGDAYSQESFDDTELANFAAQNIMFNVLASRQDAFSEAFFPTKVVTPAEGGIQITVDRQEVLDYAQHKTDGSPLGLKRSNLIDAFADHSILNRPATELVPWAKNDNSNDAFFVAESEVGSLDMDISGQTVRTRPLKMGKRVNLLSLSSHPGLIDNGILDTTDQIAPGTRLKNLYVRLTDATATPATVQVVKLDVGNMTRNQFKKSHEGQGREVVLNFISNAISIDGSTKAADGAALALLADQIATPDLAVQLSLSINGNGNLNEGSIDIHSSPVRVESVVSADGDVLALDSGAGKAVVDRLETLSASVIGYELAARRSNSNWRSTGALIDVTPYTESYAIQPGYPISVLTPTDDQQNGAKISGMINAARIRNSNNAVTTLINYAEQLEAYKAAMERGVKLDIVGAGRHVVRPFFGSKALDVSASVTSISSHERAEDVSAVLVDAIRDMAYRMYRESNYGPALDLANAGTQTKPILLIGCDAVIQRYLMISGDDRLLGENMQHRIVSTNDGRMVDNIYLTFTRERPGSEDGLTFGVHAYVPELIQRVTTSRNGSTAKNDRVVPRSIHVPVLPVVGHIRVQNLSAAIGND
jgi:hypothetical protein